MPCGVRPICWLVAGKPSAEQHCIQYHRGSSSCQRCKLAFSYALQRDERLRSSAAAVPMAMDHRVTADNALRISSWDAVCKYFVLLAGHGRPGRGGAVLRQRLCRRAASAASATQGR
jgi:hypothetical protein